MKAAIRFVRAHAADYHLDTSFVGITGFSSGGHLASLAGVTNGMKTRTVGQTTIDIEGALIGGAPADMPDMVSLISPITYVKPSCPPFLVIHGDADTVVPHCQSVNFAD